MLSRRMRTTLFGVTLVTLVLVFSGCWKHKEPNITYMPNMAYSPAIKAQEAQDYVGERNAMFLPVKGTVPRNWDDYHYPYENDLQGATRNLKNPLQPTRAVMYKGKKLFGQLCMPCHGVKGLGAGTIMPEFPRPPSLATAQVRNYPDGQIYHYIAAGKNLMPAYTTQTNKQERWALVHYVRALYRAQNPSGRDVQLSEQKDY